MDSFNTFNCIKGGYLYIMCDRKALENLLYTITQLDALTINEIAHV